MRIRELSGTAAELHGRDVTGTEEIELWSLQVTGPAVALGSRQTPDVVDMSACRRAGIEVARRRSGGGVVLLVPGHVVWVDIVVPRSSPWWNDDVVGAMIACGDVWGEALAQAVGERLTAPPVVHRGPLQRGALADLVCFAGAGPGEVFTGNAKLVGISQRRTREAARFQCALHRRWEPSRLAALLAPGAATEDDIERVPVATTDARAGELLDALASSIDAAVGR